jgi:cellulose biosynthesis protein BcsQ
MEDVIIRKRWEDITLDIVPSHIRLSDMENILMSTLDIDRVLETKLEDFKTEYDYILIDPPPSFGKVNNIALMASSFVLIPTQLAPYPVRALEYVIRRTTAVNKSKKEGLRILGVAVSMYNKTTTTLNNEMTNKINSILAGNAQEIKLFPENTWIPNLKIVTASPEKGYPICYAEFDDDLTSYEKNAAQNAFDCYTELAKHLISLNNQK